MKFVFEFFTYSVNNAFRHPRSDPKYIRIILNSWHKTTCTKHLAVVLFRIVIISSGINILEWNNEAIVYTLYIPCKQYAYTTVSKLAALLKKIKPSINAV